MVRKCAVVMALAVAVSGFAMASASAAPPIPQVPASAHPWLQTPSPADRPEPFVELRTDPIDVTAGPVTYSMQFRYYQQPSVPGGGREIAVRFTRSAPGKPNVQWHEYEYAPGSALTFTYNHQTLSRAALATGDSVAPSTFAMTYTAVHQHSSSCTLTNGQPGTLVRTNGRLAVSGFKLVSGTKPVFSTVTTRPTYASLVFDPGCDQYFGPRRRCVGTEEVEAGSAYKFWDFSADYGGSVAYQELFQLSRHPLAGAEIQPLDELRGGQRDTPVTQRECNGGNGRSEDDRRSIHDRRRDVHIHEGAGDWSRGVPGRSGAQACVHVSHVRGSADPRPNGAGRRLRHRFDRSGADEGRNDPPQVHVLGRAPRQNRSGVRDG